MYASENGHFEICKFLIEIGKADINKKSHEGANAFMLSSSKNHFEICKFLIENCKMNVNE